MIKSTAGQAGSGAQEPDLTLLIAHWYYKSPPNDRRVTGLIPTGRGLLLSNFDTDRLYRRDLSAVVTKSLNFFDKRTASGSVTSSSTVKRILVTQLGCSNVVPGMFC